MTNKYKMMTADAAENLYNQEVTMMIQQGIQKWSDDLDILMIDRKLVDEQVKAYQNLHFTLDSYGNKVWRTTLDVTAASLIDYKLKCKQNFYMTQEDTSSVNCVFKSFEYQKFSEIMKLDNINHTDIKKSFCIQDMNQLLESFLVKDEQNGGRSGSLFYFSKDRRFLIKTLRGKEQQQILSSLEQLLNHYKNTERQSLLARIYAVF